MSKTWDKIYLEIKEDLEEGNVLNPRQRGWLNYQRARRIPLKLEQIDLLNNLNDLMGCDWKQESYKNRIEVKARKRTTIKGLGKRITESRIKKGYDTISEFSKETKIAVSTIRDWEKEVSIPTSDRLVILCKKLTVSADYLLFGKKIKE